MWRKSIHLQMIFREKCIEYKFESIYKVYNRSNSRNDKKYSLGNSEFYLIQLYVNPGMALFETLIKRNATKHKIDFKVISDITRINRYGEQSICINDKILKNYCYCNDLL